MATATIDLGEDQGFITVQVKTPEGEASKTLDLLEVYTKLRALNKQTEGQPLEEWLTGVQGLLAGYGLPACSLALAHDFTAAVNRRMSEVYPVKEEPAKEATA